MPDCVISVCKKIYIGVLVVLASALIMLLIAEAVDYFTRLE